MAAQYLASSSGAYKKRLHSHNGYTAGSRSQPNTLPLSVERSEGGCTIYVRMAPRDRESTAAVGAAARDLIQWLLSSMAV